MKHDSISCYTGQCHHNLIISIMLINIIIILILFPVPCQTPSLIEHTIYPVWFAKHCCFFITITLHNHFLSWTSPPPWRSLSRCIQATPADPVARTTASLQGIRWGLAAMWTLEELPMRSPGSTWSIAGTGPCWWGLWTWSIGWFGLGLYDHSSQN